MAKKKPESGSAPAESFDAALNTFVTKFDRARTRRAGSILLRLTGENSGDFYLHSASTGCSMSRERRPAHLTSR